jgi:hypothetical protein
MVLILTVSMAIVFIYNINTAITFVYEYVSFSTDVLIMTVFIVLCVQPQNFVLFMIVAKTVSFLKAATQNTFTFRPFLFVNVATNVDFIKHRNQVT